MNRLFGYLDMNAYFASIEQQANPALRGKPVAVGGRASNTGQPVPRSVITTASYEARALGIKTAMSTREALARLPSLALVPPDYGKYQAYTKRIAELATAYSPTVELCSIDELSLDLSHLLVPKNPELTVRNIQQFVISIKAQLAATVGPFVTASIGFASSPTLAKLAADQFKPDGQFFIADTPTLARQAILQGLSAATWMGLRSRLHLTAIPGIGNRLAATLQLAGYRSLDDLATADRGTLTLKFGVLGVWLSQIARGEPTHRPTNSFQQQATEQSMSHTTTLPRDLPLAQTRAIFFVLAERVAERMHRANVVATELFVGFGRTNGPSWLTHERYHYPMTNGLELFRRGWHLVEQTWNSRGVLVRRPQIGVTRLVSRAAYPPSLLATERRTDRANQVVADLRSTWGINVIQPATILSTTIERVPDGRRARFESLARTS